MNWRFRDRPRRSEISCAVPKGSSARPSLRRASLKALPAMPYGAVVKLERRASHEGMVSVGGNLQRARHDQPAQLRRPRSRRRDPHLRRRCRRRDPRPSGRAGREAARSFIASPSATPTRPARRAPDRDARRRSRRSSLARLLRRRRPPSWRSRRRPMSAPSVIERVKTPPVALKMPRALEILDVNSRSRRIRESRKGRPCNELGLSAHCLSTACPNLRAPGAPCPGWAHHIAISLSETGGQQGADGSHTG